MRWTAQLATFLALSGTAANGQGYPQPQQPQQQPCSLPCNRHAAHTPAPQVQAPQGLGPGQGDPYGFVGWLNGVRAGYGLAPVGHDPSLDGWAGANNAQQQARGMGHYVMGPARRQNSATGEYAQIGAMWLASPAHRSALLDPTIRWVGISGLGVYWTFSAY